MKTLTIPDIDRRLLLYKEYLKYYIDEKLKIRNVLEFYTQTGNMFYTQNIFMNFEQWLADMGYYNLIVSTWTGFNLNNK